MNAIAFQTDTRSIFEEYEAKMAAADGLVEEYAAFHRKIDNAACVQGAYVGRIYNYHPAISAREVRDNLTKSGWKRVYDALNIARVASARDRKLFEQTLANPPEFNRENVAETFKDYVLNPRQNILRGLAEVFVGLDPAYKSHSKVMIGVKALPKRIILSNVNGYGSYGYERLMDTLNAIRSYEGRPLVTHQDIETFIALERLREKGGLEPWLEDQQYERGAIVSVGQKIYKLQRYRSTPGEFVIDSDGDGWRQLVHPFPGLSLKLFQNGNGHLHFDRHYQVLVNKALAEYYGDILPDFDADADKPKRTMASTAVAKDLQYYPTPAAVVSRLLGNIILREGEQVLEPSCGCGRILDALPKHCVALGIEVHPGRADEARSKGHKVLTANFLEAAADPRFDKVLMNPPFYGTHYIKHIKHALKFLKPKGVLLAILPATAWYDHGLLPEGGRWEDLPVGSFSESGTNIPTGIFTFWPRDSKSGGR